jgi:hypothetical protein
MGVAQPNSTDVSRPSRIATCDGRFPLSAEIDSHFGRHAAKGSTPGIAVFALLLPRIHIAARLNRKRRDSQPAPFHRKGRRGQGLPGRCISATSLPERGHRSPLPGIAASSASHRGRESLPVCSRPYGCRSPSAPGHPTKRTRATLSQPLSAASRPLGNANGSSVIPSFATDRATRKWAGVARFHPGGGRWGTLEGRDGRRGHARGRDVTLFSLGKARSMKPHHQSRT